MRRFVRSIGMLAGLAAAVVLVVGVPASAKILGVESLKVTTARPHVGAPVTVVVRIGNGFHLSPQLGWAKNEIEALPTERTDRDGWPLDRADLGLPIRLHLVRAGVYRGSFTVADPGSYVVISRSAFYANEDRLRGVVMTGDIAAPIRVHVAAAASSGSGSSWMALAAALMTSAALAASAVWWRRRRRQQQNASDVPAQSEERELVGSGGLR